MAPVGGLEHEQVGVVGDLVGCAGVCAGVPAAGHPGPTVRILVKENLLQRVYVFYTKRMVGYGVAQCCGAGAGRSQTF